MVQKVQLVLEDDIDGGAAHETVNFGLDGVSYEIDLNAEHAAQLRDALASWVGHARKVKAPVARGTTTTRRSRSGSDTAAVREWAKANGYTVSDRGRIAAEVQEAYAKANG
ncbi:Lsr2 family protein [Promicromonospora thailandica]|uniref:Lsr2 protein n=1 Tax=Promicromonospora thailandica TaxID=765201 RepID=A0A9X2JZX0_9MICO|nr:Lsr2 family protein [Promicromonospora thailandica]MCP2266479.1 Lsr2 protein [Promicromonospora thailandica]BFF20167.1 Lsr2 family protein [Promicromonospora thailandica]